MELQTDDHQKLIVLAGSTGALGQIIAQSLLQNGAHLRALIRKGANAAAVQELKTQGAEIIEVDFAAIDELKKACTGARCVVSALSGVGNVIIDIQANLLKAAVEAGVPRFIPSDFCIDYIKLPEGSNRNLDLRRTFNRLLDESPIKGTSILNGMFTDLLTGQAPVVLFGIKRIIYWGSANQPLDFTTMRDAAIYTAAAAMDATTPRYLKIAGDVCTIRDLQAAATQASGKKFKLLRAGGLGLLKAMIKITRTIKPADKETFPPWQGMQYLHNMFTGLPKLQPLDNNRYAMQWTSVREVLAEKQRTK